MPLAPGDPAPPFMKASHDGQEIQIGGKRNRVLVLYFYPADETTGCTMEACAFRDVFAQFVHAGADVVGVSRDSLDSHRAFAENHRLPFPLVSDTNGAMRRAYRVGKTLGIIPDRVTFVIDKNGIIRHVYSSQILAKKHVTEALRIVRVLAGND